jgi:hypothetical protein
MHFNGTNDYLSKSGKYLVNVQSPSLAVYGAAYKIVRFDTPRKVDVQTVALNKVPRFNELFPLYEMEWKYVEGSSNAGHGPAGYQGDLCPARRPGRAGRCRAVQAQRRLPARQPRGRQCRAMGIGLERC